MTRVTIKIACSLLIVGFLLSALWFISSGDTRPDFPETQASQVKDASVAAASKSNFPQEISESVKRTADVEQGEAEEVAVGTESRQAYVKPAPSESIRESVDPKQPGNFIALNGVCLRLIETTVNGNADETAYVFDVENVTENRSQSAEFAGSMDQFRARWGRDAFNQAIILANAEVLKEDASKSRGKQ